MSHLLLFAVAMGDGAPSSGIASILQSPLPMLVIMMVIWYFLLIRPQQRKQKQLANEIAAIKKNDAIVTIGGLHGTVVAINDKTLSVRIADNVRVEFDKNAVQSVAKSTGGTEK